MAGCRGTLPAVLPQWDVTQYGLVNDAVTDNSAALNNLISTSGGNLRVLYFPAGSYRFTTTVYTNDSLVLRGAGSDSTRFLFDFGGNSGDGITCSGSANSAWLPVTYGYRRGSDRIVATGASALQPGQWLEIRQQNGSWDTQPVSWADYSVGQLMEVVSVQGDTLFLSEPLRIDYDSALNVEVSTFTPARQVHIECLSFQRTDSASCFCPALNFRHAVDCSVRGVEGLKSISAHLLLDASSHITVTGSYFHDAYEYNGSSMHGYGIALINHTGSSLIEDNILKHLRHSFSLQTGANGNVIAYNYSLDPNRSEFPANFGADISMHGHFPYANLFEGNIVQNIQLDQTWGPSGPLNTFFRNRAELYGILMTSGTVNSDTQNFVGNEVTGTAAFQGNYSLAGSGHFEFGNNIRGTITPAGTGTLNDISCYRTALPLFWNITQQWPSIGFPNGAGSGTIPARERYLSSGEKTLCGPQSSTGTSALNMSSGIRVYPNPVQSGETVRISIDRSKSNFWELQELTGRLIRHSDCRESQMIEIPTTGMPAGIYLLRIFNDDGYASERILLTE
jgi:hypothetical protein